MMTFMELMGTLSRTKDGRRKVAAVERFFRDADPRTAAWAFYLLSGKKLPAALRPSELRRIVGAAMTLPDWLIKTSYDVVGDWAETIALCCPDSDHLTALPLHELIEQLVLPLRSAQAASVENETVRMLTSACAKLDSSDRTVFNKLVTGTFRSPIRKSLLIEAIARAMDVDEAQVEARLANDWHPRDGWDWPSADSKSESDGCMAAIAFDAIHVSGSTSKDWWVEEQPIAERVHLIRGMQGASVWSPKQGDVSDRHANIARIARRLPPNTRIDGFIVGGSEAADGASPMLWVDQPARFVASDLLMHRGEDLRTLPLIERRKRLESLSAEDALFEATAIRNCPGMDNLPVSPGIHRLILRRKDSSYIAGSAHADALNLPAAHHEADLVLLSVRAGRGAGAGECVEYNLGAWNGNELAPVAKVDATLPEDQKQVVARHARRHATGRFGPVRAVAPALVIRVAFEAVTESRRTRSGLTLTGVKAISLSKSAIVAEAASLQSLRALIGAAT